jgi:hypothetical protein
VREGALPPEWPSITVLGILSGPCDQLQVMLLIMGFMPARPISDAAR